MSLNDLHVHTTVSDGRLTPAEVIVEAARHSVETLVLTDHSALTYSSWVQHASDHGVELPFPGMEVSTSHGPFRHHVLLFGWALTDLDEHPLLALPNQRKNRLLAEVVDVLRRDAPDLPDFTAIFEGRADGMVPAPERRLLGRRHVAQALAAVTGRPQQQCYETVREIHADLSGRDRGQRYPDTPAVLDLAAAHGLTAVIAHPLWQVRDAGDIDPVLADLDGLVSRGVWGMASRSYHHRAFDDHPDVLALTRRRGLAVVGGSDFHGNGRTQLGSDPTHPDVLEQLRVLVAERSGSALAQEAEHG